MWAAGALASCRATSTCREPPERCTDDRQRGGTARDGLEHAILTADRLGPALILLPKRGAGPLLSTAEQRKAGTMDAGEPAGLGNSSKDERARIEHARQELRRDHPSLAGK